MKNSNPKPIPEIYFKRAARVGVSPTLLRMRVQQLNWTYKDASTRPPNWKPYKKRRPKPVV